MLPKDAKSRRQATMKDTQQRLDPHLEEKPARERIIPYTDDLFREAAIEWLVSNDQVSEAPTLITKLYINTCSIIADPSISQSCVPKDDTYCGACNQWGEDSKWPPNTPGNPRHLHSTAGCSA
jgi:hypothetical protein